jgi:hypothetical protein
VIQAEGPPARPLCRVSISIHLVVLLQIELRVLRVRVSPLSAPSTSETGAIVSPIIKRLPGKSDAAVSPRTCDKPNSKLLDTPEKPNCQGSIAVACRVLISTA